jgi:hypothetical protein
VSLQLWDDGVTLLRRLEVLGLAGVKRLVVHENRTVMVSLSRGILRIHRGYVYAADKVLRAVIAFLQPGGSRVRSRRAQRELLGFPVEEFVPVAAPARRREAPRPGDEKVIARLRATHARFNAEHFGGTLPGIPIRLSGRMRRRLGELLLDPSGTKAREITISRRHLRRDGWAEVEATLLHEMVHQWQAETGIPVDHGAKFRKKAREVGVEPSAKRDVDASKAAREEHGISRR